MRTNQGFTPSQRGQGIYCNRSAPASVPLFARGSQILPNRTFIREIYDRAVGFPRHD